MVEPTPTSTAGDSDEREQALERIKKRRDFSAHLFSYVVINAGVWAVWAFTGGGYAWPAWVSGAWAVGVVFNAWDVYVRRPITEADIAREIHRLHAEP